MTRIFTDGAEMGDIKFFDIPASAATTGTVKRSGSYCYYNNTGTARRTIPDLSELYFRMGMYPFPIGQGYEFLFFSHDSTSIVSIMLNVTYHMALYVGGGLVSSGSITFQDSVWYLLEIYIKVADSPNGRVITKIDGVIDIDYTGDTKPGADTHINNIGFYKTGATGSLYFDDLALNDTDNSDGKNDNSWCGDGRVIKITPSGSSATTNDWLNSGSVSGSANYLYVDEYPNDGDTTYVYASGSDVGLQTQFSMSDETFAGKTILRIYPEARVKKTTAELDTIKLGFLASGGTDTMSGSSSLSIGDYTRIVGDGTKINPVTSASWTEAGINALEFVAEVGPSG